MASAIKTTSIFERFSSVSNCIITVLHLRTGVLNAVIMWNICQ